MYGSESSILAGLQSAPQHKAANAGNGQFLSGLLAILAQHPQAADQGVGILQSVLGSIGQQQAQQQAMQQERRAGAQHSATGYATSPGATTAGLEGIIQANYPNMANKPFGQNLIAGLSQSIPGGSDAGTIPAEDIAVMQEQVKAMADAAPAGDEGAYTMHQAAQHFADQFRAAGAPQATIDAAVAYVQKLWGEYKGYVSVAPAPPPVASTSTPSVEAGPQGPLNLHPPELAQPVLAPTINALDSWIRQNK